MKRVIVAATTLLLSVCTNAQNDVGRWSLQPKAGINLATMTNDDEAKTRIAFVAGAELEYQATPLLSVSAGALYSQQGSDADSQGMNGTIKMDYVNIPILANFYVAKGFAVKVGIQPGFLVNDKVKVSSNGVSAEVGLKDAYKAAGIDADISSFDLAIPLGISYEFNHVVLDARYNLSL
ncbi:MAG: PorT family protein, partial [Prevotella sp.]|nr:PorT family protein [Prevotella sp.]